MTILIEKVGTYPLMYGSESDYQMHIYIDYFDIKKGNTSIVRSNHLIFATTVHISHSDYYWHIK